MTHFHDITVLLWHRMRADLERCQSVGLLGLEGRNSEALTSRVTQLEVATLLSSMGCWTSLLGRQAAVGGDA